MQQQHFKAALDEFSNKPYLSLSHNVYPVDEKEESKEGTPPLSESQSSSEDEIRDDMDDLNLNPKKKQIAGLAKLKIFIKISPVDFMEIKKHFALYENEVGVTQFVIIFLDVLIGRTSLDEQVKGYVQGLVELYQMIDLYDTKLISFDQLSNFLVEMHEILDRDQSIFEIRLRPRPLNSALELVAMERLFDLQGYSGFAYLEQNQKTIRLVNPRTWEEQLNVSIGQTSIINALFLQKQNTLLISSNDKFLNFFDIQSHKLIRRFMAPDVQTFIQVSPRKGIIYTAAVNGNIYAWSIERIFSKEFLKAMTKHPDCFKLVMMDSPINAFDLQGSRENSLGCMLLIESLHMIATGSSDAIIRLFDNKQKLNQSSKQLKGHQKSIKVIYLNYIFNQALSYCSQYRYLVSCSYDFDVLIWNIYLDHPLAKLVGHEAPLITILTIQERRPHLFSLILSCDAKGVLKVWDPKTFQNIQHINVTEGDQRVKSMVYKKENSLLMVAYKKLQLYQIDQSYDGNVTDDAQISCFCYSKKYMEIHIAQYIQQSTKCSTSKHIKSWDIEQGIVKRILKDVGDQESDITTMTMDETERRIFVSLHSGKIMVFDIFTGFKLRTMSEYTKELCHMSYSNTYKLLISIGWEQQVRIFNDAYSNEKNKDKENALRVIKNAHTSEILAGTFSEHLMLIATSTRDGELRLWDFEKVNFITKLRTTGKEIIALRFLDPYPLLISSDTSGTLTLHIVRPHEMADQAALVWKNMFTIMKASQVTCIDSFNEDSLVCVLGDENGELRLINFNEVLSKLNIKPISFNAIAQNKNLHRFFQVTYVEFAGEVTDKVLTEGLMNEKHARQQCTWKGHKSGVKSMRIMNETITMSLITLAQDRLVKIWSLDGTLLQALRLGNDPKLNQYHLHLKPDYLKHNDILLQDVMKNFEKVKEKKEVLRKNRRGGNIRRDEDNQKLAHVESSEIFKDLQEINQYLEMRGKDAEPKQKQVIVGRRVGNK